jgi:hypothetical protein
MVDSGLGHVLGERDTDDVETRRTIKEFVVLEVGQCQPG